MRKSAMRSPNSPMKVFISYATEDYKETRRIFEDLKAVGVAPWFDREKLVNLLASDVEDNV